MSTRPLPRLFSIPLVRELAVILVLKLLLLWAIKVTWFDAPVIPPGGPAKVAEHLLATENPSVPDNPEENSR